MSRSHPSRHASGPRGRVFTSLISLAAACLLAPASSLAMLRWDSHSVVLPDTLAVNVSDRTLAEAAQHLEQQAGDLYSAGRYEEALKAQLNSVEIHRKLVAEDPGQHNKLAASLHNLGVVLIRLGRKTEAIPPTEEALSLYRSVAQSLGAEASQSLERPLRNLVLLYFEANRPQDAMPLADDLVRLHQSRSLEDPMAKAAQVDVLNLRASVLVALNRTQEARRDLEGAVGLARSLARSAPQNLGLQYGLAGSLVNLSQVSDALGAFDQALSPAQEAEALLRQVARAQPQLIGDWAKSLSRLGQAYAQMGQPASARPPLEESIALLRVLASSGLSGTLAVEVGGYRDDLAHALEALAVVQHQLRHPLEARAAAEEAMAIYRALARLDPTYGKDVERTRSWLTSLPKTTPVRH